MHFFLKAVFLGAVSASNTCQNIKDTYAGLQCCGDNPEKGFKAVDGVTVTSTPCPTVIGMSPTGASQTQGCIYLGLIMDYTGPYKPVQPALEAAIRGFWRTVNGKGGIQGNSGSYSVAIRPGKDSAYNPINHTIAYNALKDDVFALAISLGTPQTLAVLDDMDRDNMVAAPMSWTSMWSNATADKGLILENAASYCSQGAAIFDFWYGRIRAPGASAKVGIHGFPGDYGSDALNGMKTAMQARGVSVALDLFEPQQPWMADKEAPDYESNMQAWLAPKVAAYTSNPVDFMLFASSPAATLPLITAFEGAAATAGIAAPYYGFLSPAYNDAFVKDATSPITAKLLQSSITTSYTMHYEANTPGHKEMQDAMAMLPPNNFLAAGWLSQHPVLAALEALVESGDDMTRANLRARAANLHVDFKGMTGYRVLSDSFDEQVVIAKPDTAMGSTIRTIAMVPSPVSQTTCHSMPH